jgi:GT2 family glycosyltransferase
MPAIQTAETQKDVSIIVVNWNTKDVLRNCLQSIYKETVGITFEIIVVDNGSSDASVRMVRQEFPSVTLIENSENRGFAAANNQGILIAEGRYILLLNSDTIVLDNAVAQTVSFADCNPKAGAVGCRVLNSDGTLQSTCLMFPSLLNMALSTFWLNRFFPDSKFFGRAELTWWDKNNVREVDVVGGCFMLVRRDAMSQVGLMDEQFFMYAEDTDWCYRFRKAGWKIIFTPSAEIIHLGGESSKQANTKMTLQLRGSKLLFFKKHRGPLVYALACLLLALFFLLRIPYWFIRALFSSKRNRNKCLSTGWVYIKGMLCALAGGRELYRAR